MQNGDPILTGILALLPNLSISAVFVFAWFQERRERQANLVTLMGIQAANQAMLASVVERQFELMSRLQVQPKLPGTIAQDGAFMIDGKPGPTGPTGPA